MDSAEEPHELPEGTGSGTFFLLVMAMTILLVIVQLTQARQYIWLGAFVIALGGVLTAFLVRVGRSPRAGKNNSEDSNE
jgi:hypothetical protein